MDDDIYVNIPALVDTLRSHDPLNRVYIGRRPEEQHKRTLMLSSMDKYFPRYVRFLFL